MSQSGFLGLDGADEAGERSMVRLFRVVCVWEYDIKPVLAQSSSCPQGNRDDCIDLPVVFSLPSLQDGAAACGRQAGVRFSSGGRIENNANKRNPGPRLSSHSRIPVVGPCTDRPCQPSFPCPATLLSVLVPNLFRP